MTVFGHTFLLALGLLLAVAAGFVAWATGLLWPTYALFDRRRLVLAGLWSVAYVFVSIAAFYAATLTWS